VTPSGDAQHSFEQAKINESSIKFDGTDDKLTTSTNADFALGTSDYTIEFWLYKSATMTNHSVGHTSVGDSEGHGFQIEYTSNKLGLYIWDLNNDWTHYNYEDSEAATGSWFHYAWVRNGTSFVLYKNGTAQSATTTSSSSISPTTNSWELGSHRSASSRYFNGFMDQIRISDTARYTSNFTAPTSEMTSDSNTLLLIQSKASSFIGADVSGQGNHFEESNITALAQSTDTCTNNYNVLNILTSRGGGTIEEGNLKYTASGSDSSIFGTLGIPPGMKVYFEVKLTNNTAQNAIGIHNQYDPGGTFVKGGSASGMYSFKPRGSASVTQYFNNGSSTNTSTSNYANDTIIGVAVDNENGQIHYHVNGTYLNSSDPTDNNPAALVTGFGGSSEQYLHFSLDTTTSQPINQYNFGSPPYNISSGNSDGNGHGNFEYAVPSGYYALNTKNLAEFG